MQSKILESYWLSGKMYEVQRKEASLYCTERYEALRNKQIELRHNLKFVLSEPHVAEMLMFDMTVFHRFLM